MSVPKQLRPFPSPDPTLILACYQGRHGCAVAQILILIQSFYFHFWTLNIFRIFQQLTFHDGFGISFWISQLISSTSLKGSLMPSKKAHFPARHSILVCKNSPFRSPNTHLARFSCKKINFKQAVAHASFHFSHCAVIFRFIVLFVVSLYHIREIR